MRSTALVHEKFLQHAASTRQSSGHFGTGRERLIRTRLIRSSTYFEVTVKYLSIIVLIFHV